MMKLFSRAMEAPKFEKEIIKEAREEIEEIIKKNPTIKEAIEVVKTIDDGVTLRHSMKVAELITDVANELKMSNEEKEILMCSALVHDIGKKFVDNSLLENKGEYTQEERRDMQEHVRHGFEYLMKKGEDILAEIVVRHHQHKNYPRNKEQSKEVEEKNSSYLDRRKEKPEFDKLARILSIVDIIEATGDYHRPYNNIEEALLQRKRELEEFNLPWEKEIINFLEKKEAEMKKEKAKRKFL